MAAAGSCPSPASASLRRRLTPPAAFLSFASPSSPSRCSCVACLSPPSCPSFGCTSPASTPSAAAPPAAPASPDPGVHPGPDPASPGAAELASGAALPRPPPAGALGRTPAEPDLAPRPAFLARLAGRGASGPGLGLPEARALRFPRCGRGTRCAAAAEKTRRRAACTSASENCDHSTREPCEHAGTAGGSRKMHVQEAPLCAKDILSHGTGCRKSVTGNRHAACCEESRHCAPSRSTSEQGHFRWLCALQSKRTQLAIYLSNADRAHSTHSIGAWFDGVRRPPQFSQAMRFVQQTAACRQQDRAAPSPLHPRRPAPLRAARPPHAAR